MPFSTLRQIGEWAPWYLQLVEMRQQDSSKLRWNSGADAGSVHEIVLFDWLVTGQVVPVNPAHSVREPRHSVSTGITPVLSSEEATALLAGMDVSSVVGLRDRAIIAVMTYTFARVGAVIALNVEDYYSQKKRWWLRLH